MYSLEEFNAHSVTELIEDAEIRPSEYELSIIRAQEEVERIEPKNDMLSKCTEPKDVVCENVITDTKIEDNLCELDVINFDEDEPIDKSDVDNVLLDQSEVNAVSTDHVDEFTAPTETTWNEDTDECVPHHLHSFISSEQTIMTTVVKTVEVVSQHEHTHEEEKDSFKTQYTHEEEKDAFKTHIIEKPDPCCANSTVVTQETQVIVTKKSVSNGGGVVSETTITTDEEGTEIIKKMFSGESNVLEFFNEDIPSSNNIESQPNNTTSLSELSGSLE